MLCAQDDALASAVTQCKGHSSFLTFRYLSVTCLDFGDRGLSSSMFEPQGYRLLVVYEDVDAQEPTSYNLFVCQRSSVVEQRFRNSKPKGQMVTLSIK